MKIELPNAEEWLNKNCHSVDWNSLEEQVKDGILTGNVILYLKEYGELCAEYGAKSIRYQVIDKLQDMINLEISCYADINVEELIRDIQNLNP